MFNNLILEQFLALQGKTSELTGNMRSISIDMGKEVMEIHRNAAQDLSAMGQGYLKKLTTMYDPTTTPTMFGAHEFGQMLEYWAQYQDSLKKAINQGGHALFNEMEGLSTQARYDLEKIVNGLTNNGPIAGTPIMAAVKVGLDMLMQSCDQLAATTKSTMVNMEKFSNTKI